MHTQPAELSQHTVGVFFMQTVRDNRVRKSRGVNFVFLQTLNKVGTGLFHPSGHLDDSNHLLLQVAVIAQTVHALYKHIDTFIAILVTTAGRDNHRVIVESVAS